MSYRVEWSTEDTIIFPNLLELYGVFFLLDQQTPARRSSEFLLVFLQVIGTALVCLAPVTDCSTSPTRGVRRNAARVSRKKKRHPIFASRHGVITHKTPILSNSAMRISNVQKKSVITYLLRIFLLPSVRIQQMIYVFVLTWTEWLLIPRCSSIMLAHITTWISRMYNVYVIIYNEAYLYCGVCHIQ
jgi:hypothetical protein